MHAQRPNAILVGAFVMALVIGGIAGAVIPHPPHDRPFWLPLIGVPLFLAVWYAPLTAVLTAAHSGENLKYESDDSEFLEQLASERAKSEGTRTELEERIGQLADPSRHAWKCSKCGSDNPAEFDLCWKCDGSRDE